jgi:hypothetical protein
MISEYQSESIASQEQWFRGNHLIGIENSLTQLSGLSQNQFHTCDRREVKNSADHYLPPKQALPSRRIR